MADSPDSNSTSSYISSSLENSNNLNSDPIHLDNSSFLFQNPITPSVLQLPNPTNFIPNMAYVHPNPVTSVLTMPNPGTRLAPEKFRGDFDKVKEFIQYYERLCAQNNVTLDAEKCETLLRYCSKRERETIKNIPSYVTPNWNRLKADILKLYDADLDTKRYTIKDVREFSKKHKEKEIHDLAAWRKY